MEVFRYHGENFIFTVNEYRKDCDDKGHIQGFSVVGTHHQNVQ